MMRQRKHSTSVNPTGLNSFQAALNVFTKTGPVGRTTGSNGLVSQSLLGAVIGN
jgi:hypothetical protein